MSEKQTNLRQRALDFLSRREHSQVELCQKLGRYSDDSHEITSIINELTANNWQSNRRFAEMLIHSKQSKHGNAHLRQLLRQHQIDESDFADLLPDEETEVDTAVAILEKKFRQPENDIKQRQKYNRFLLYRGFKQSTCHTAITRWQEEHTKEY